MIPDLWYKNTVMYSLDLESFMDANGDGIGDFVGLINHLDYLQALGVGTIWLAPFQPTPNRDNGYDIADYYGVDPRHGCAGDFVEFMHQAEKRGIKVIIDLVVNHTSTDHRWFQEARSSPDSFYRNWYHWSKKRPKNWRSGMVFPGVQESTWTYDRKAQSYYYHRFYEHQADLNMDTPAVRAEINKIMGFWLQLGVAGFRVDAVPFIIEQTEPGVDQGALRFNYLADMREFLQWRKGDAILLGEANVLPEEMLPYFAEDRPGLNMMFNFYVNQHLFYALASGEIQPLIDALESTRELPPNAQWAHFLRNHDELDLGRLTEKQRKVVFERFGPDPAMQLYDRGIRRRLAPMLGDRRHIELAYSLVFSFPGTPVLRYGDEIGMGDDLSLTERDAVRTPMQWSDEPQAGFSTAKKTVLPLIDEGVYNYKAVNVENQRRDPESLLNWTAAMIRLRQECPEIGWGEWQILPTGEERVLAMRYDWRGCAVVIVHNFGDMPCEITLKPGGEAGKRLIDLRQQEQSYAEDGAHRMVLDAYGYRWFRVGSLNYAMSRQPWSLALE